MLTLRWEISLVKGGMNAFVRIRRRRSPVVQPYSLTIMKICSSILSLCTVFSVMAFAPSPVLSAQQSGSIIPPQPESPAELPAQGQHPAATPFGPPHTYQPHSSAADSDFGAASNANQPGSSYSQPPSGTRLSVPSWANFLRNMVERSRAGGAFVGATFYLIGGEIDDTVYGTNRAHRVEIFKGPTVSWSPSLTDMPIPVSNICGSVAAVGSKIYVFGGWTGAATRTNAIQVYDTQADTWAVHPTQLTRALYGCVAVATKNHGIFLCGGSIQAGMGGATTDECFYFDPSIGVLTPTTPMGTAQFLHSGDTVEDQVYVAAGYGTGTIFQRFDLNLQTWTALPNLPNDRAGCGMTLAEDYCLFYGGDWNGYRNDCDAYHTLSNTFNPALSAALGTMPTGKRSFAYDDYQSPFFQVALSVNGWSGNYLANCTALY
jgi:hypothetical protein